MIKFFSNNLNFCQINVLISEYCLQLKYLCFSHKLHQIYFFMGDTLALFDNWDNSLDHFCNKETNQLAATKKNKKQTKKNTQALARGLIQSKDSILSV